MCHKSFLLRVSPHSTEGPALILSGRSSKSQSVRVRIKRLDDYFEFCNRHSGPDSIVSKVCGKDVAKRRPEKFSIALGALQVQERIKCR